MPERSSRRRPRWVLAVGGVLTIVLGGLLLNFLTGGSRCVVPLIGAGCLPPPPPPTCPPAPFGWTRQIADRDPEGVYVFDLAPCETLWFNSGSILVNGSTLGGGLDSQNTVLLYQTTVARRLQVSVGDPADRGNEWWGVTSADVADVLRGWQDEALKAPNCGTGCSSLQVYRFEDDRYLGYANFP